MEIMWSKTLRPGGKWSGIVGRGKLLRFTALEGGANLSMLLYNAWNPCERYNMPDTLKAQHTAYLTAGNVLMSDNGRVLASITADTVGWHDTISGYSFRHDIDRKYGVTRYQDERNEWFRSGQENFAVELVRNGLTLRDLVPPVNLFAKVSVDDDGQLIFHPNHCPQGGQVTLRTDMDLLLILSNTPNPLDPRSTYPSTPVQVDVLPANPVGDDDICVTHCPENLRAFENTWEYYALRNA
ncbi:urea amidolyase associated protein UAAP1 [Sulfobacillus thermosulfidooxidans]|uniref:urea amidolyase associated protein UAAP1 n=1 Tax=Sulfobacillus thermosulfidooxidans TaxID=28034 RepID=UPI00096B7A50|nr:urea amidolyase associated protein UAAP1 [Sulfobacillus thermosulfidooxidans]OLZ11072.1 urea carboxylase [Sulfobacillus thermosulfidooxidans]OLZ13491.1 urea carboxylase [Sulfobacillus thermosulfidooxidans]OLZ20756.1 urea carboxylase [Sulfobacillus thermosulfidooxidans]